MTNVIDWRNQPVHRDAEYEALVEQFCSSKSPGNTKNVVFQHIKDFMIFAALVGFQLDLYKPLKSKNNTIKISLDTYSTTELDAYIYLMALSKYPTLDILKNENLKQTIEVFEAYCNGGLAHIKKWVFDNVGKHSSANILFNQTLDSNF